MLKDLCFEIIQTCPNKWKRKEPLCKQVYGFNGDLIESDETIR